MKILYIKNEQNNNLKDIEALSKKFEVESYPSDNIPTNIDCIIQNNNPKLWARYGPMKHIGHLDIIPDDSYLPFTTVDEIWASNMHIFEFVAKRFSGIIKYVPHAVDSEIYKKDYKFNEISEVAGTFCFLYSSIDSDVDRSLEILESFWREFDPTEPVSLILHSKNISKEIIDNLKKKLNLYNNQGYQKFVLIENQLAVEQQLGLSYISNCYINTTNNWSDHIVHSIGFNKRIISTCNSIVNNYLNFSPIETVTVEEIKSAMRYSYGIKFNHFPEKYDLKFLDEESFLERINGSI